MKYRIPVDVECSCVGTERDLSTHKGEEVPQSFRLWKHTHTVKEVLDKWLASEHRYFKVKAEDDAVYILRYDGESCSWELTLFSKIE